MKKERKKRTLLQKVVNVFLYIGIGVLFILLVAFGFSQTSTFRNYLKNFIVNEVNSSIPGKLEIGELNGTIFTSLSLRNTVFILDGDTVLNSDFIAVKTSPLHLLIKTIYLRNVVLRNTKVNLKVDEEGKLNISKLFQSTSSDTSKFPFTIEVANLRLKNVDFSLSREGDNVKSEYYDSLNTSDLRISDISLGLNGSFDIGNNQYNLDIDDLSAKTNIKGFALENLSGDFFLGAKGMAVKDFSLKTERSKITLNSFLENYDMFGKNSDLAAANTNLKLQADSLDFDDISIFVPQIKFLKGKIFSDIKASGKFSDLKIQNIKLNYDSTQLYAHGSIRNLQNSSTMFINTNFYDSYINASDVNKLMPSLSIGSINNIGTAYFDSLYYYGNPLNFNAAFSLRNSYGNIHAKSNFNFMNKVTTYNLTLSTKNLNLLPVAGVTSSLNLDGSIDGQGFNPQVLNTKIKLSGTNSTLQESKIDSLNFEALAKSKVVKYNLNAQNDSSGIHLNGDFDFTDPKNVDYTLGGKANNLNLASLLYSNKYESNLNFSVNAKGENFDPDKAKLNFDVYLFKSVFRSEEIDSLNAAIVVGYEENHKRFINLTSNLLDLNIEGQPVTEETLKFLSDELFLTSYSITKKIHQIYPSVPETSDSTLNTTMADKISLPENVSVKYKINLKDFRLLSLFLNQNHLELNGNLEGNLNTDSSGLNISLTSDINYVKFWNQKDVFFLSNLNINSNFNKALNSDSIKDIAFNLDAKCDRIFVGKNIRDLALSLKVKNEESFLNFSGKFEDYASANFSGKADFSSNNLKLNLDSLRMSYNNFVLNNAQPVIADISESSINLDNFNLFNKDGTTLQVSGNLLKSGNQNMTIKVNNLDGAALSENFLGLKPTNALYSKINFLSNINGTYSTPVINSKLNVNDITYKNKKFGSLTSNFSLKNNELLTDLKFIENSDSTKEPTLVVKGNIPVKFEASGDSSNTKSAGVNLYINANHFNLETFGNTLPYLNELTGDLSANLVISGTSGDLNPSGNFTIRNASFVLSENNLKYDCTVKAQLKPDLLTLDTLLIANASDTRENRRIIIWGNAGLNDLNIVSSNFNVNGSLKVLGFTSKAVSPSVYGNLVIATNGNVQFTTGKSGALLEAPISVVVANLVFSPAQRAYSNSLNNYIYRFAKDTSSNKSVSFENLVKLSQERENAGKSEVKKLNFNYKVDVDVKNEAKIVFILSKEFNQKLTAILNGNFQYERINGRANAQGELKLLDGSNLDFIKTFTAGGSLKFESDLDNPYLDITATYTDYYYPPTASTTTETTSSTGNSTNGSTTKSTATNEELVAVKIKLQGPLKDLNKNFIQNKQNISVYVGENNINNNIASTKYDVSDAIMFITMGRFVNEESGTSQGPLEGTTTALAGSLLGGFLNSYLGDYVRSVQLRKVGNNYKVNLSGRVKDFRYSIGGSTDVFSDLSQTNIKIEYPITNSLLLRIERKQSINESNINNDMINEFGLKYKFEF